MLRSHSNSTPFQRIAVSKYLLTICVDCVQSTLGTFSTYIQKSIYNTGRFLTQFS